MNLKYYKCFFISTIIFLSLAGIYVVYIKDNGNINNVQAKTKDIEISKEISIGITNFDTINPILTKNLEIQHITKLIYDPLINITEDFDIEPAIAEEWSKLDELTYIIKLDENKKWENGDNVRVEDIEFTIKTIQEADTIYKENVEKITNIEKVNDNTLKIHLKEPVDFFEYLLCFPIIKENTYNSKIPRGTGKYKIISIDENQIIIQGPEIRLIVKIYRNPTEVYNQFTRENIDLIITGNTDYETYIGNIGFEETIIPGREFYYISCENIEDIETRNAIRDNLNREKIIYELYDKKYIVAEFPLAYGSFLNKENTENKDNNTIKQRKFTLSTDNKNIEIAEKIKKQLEEKGITISIQSYKNVNADLILEEETIPITPQISRYFNNEEIKEQIEKITKIENKDILEQEYSKIIDRYYKELPFISLYFNSYIILHNNKIKGDFSGTWYNLFYNIDTWYKIL